MKFRTTILAAGKSATGLPVPDETINALGASKKPAVVVTVGGYTYRSTIASRNGSFIIPLSAENREAAGVAAGDEVEVDVVLDAEPRKVQVPDDFAAALDKEPLARERVDLMSYSNQLGHVQLIDGAKTPESRQRRINKALDTLSEGV